MFRSYVCFGALALALSVPAFAQDQNPGESKENKIFEAQGSTSIVKVIEAIQDASILTDGVLQTGFTIRQGGSAFTEVAIESRVWGREEWKKEVYCSSYETCYIPGIHVIPFEVKMRAQVKGDKNIALDDLRLSAIRLLMTPGGALGITIQGLSWVMKNPEFGSYNVNMFEVASLTLNTALGVNENGSIEIVLKGNVRGGVGGRFSSDAAIVDETKATATWDNDPTGTPWYLSAAGSVGVRFAKKVLVDFFGGMDRYAKGTDYKGFKRGNEENGTYEETSADLSTKTGYIGAGVRYMPTSWLNILLSVKAEQVTTSLSYDGYASGSATETSKSANAIVELRW